MKFSFLKANIYYIYTRRKIKERIGTGGTGHRLFENGARSQGTTNIICTYLATIYRFKIPSSWIVDRIVVPQLYLQIPHLLNSVFTVSISSALLRVRSRHKIFPREIIIFPRYKEMRITI